MGDTIDVGQQKIEIGDVVQSCATGSDVKCNKGFASRITGKGPPLHK
jgi:hypothetical protein